MWRDFCTGGSNEVVTVAIHQAHLAISVVETQVVDRTKTVLLTEI